MNRLRTGVFLWSLMCSFCVQAEAPARIAVAANFKSTLEVLIEVLTGSEAAERANYQIISGSTGLLFAQISAGAPFDLFLAADAARAEQLQGRDGLLHRTAKTYAQGILALWIPTRNTPWPVVLANFDGDLALANPELAPYGAAASVLLAKPLFHQAPRMIQGNNVHQAYQFVETGNAQAALISLAQLIQANVPRDQYYLPTQTHYPLIIQKRILLSDHPAAEALDKFLSTPRAQAIVRRAGYRSPMGSE